LNLQVSTLDSLMFWDSSELFLDWVEKDMAKIIQWYEVSDQLCQYGMFIHCFETLYLHCLGLMWRVSPHTVPSAVSTGTAKNIPWCMSVRCNTHHIRTLMMKIEAISKMSDTNSIFMWLSACYLMILYQLFRLFSISEGEQTICFNTLAWNYCWGKQYRTSVKIMGTSAKAQTRYLLYTSKTCYHSR
jgi:hypothetical protein